jgi:hypothetical protein
VAAVTAPPRRTDPPGSPVAATAPEAPAASVPRGEVLRLAARAYARYAIPLTLLAALALAPWLVAALSTPPPPNLSSARRLVRFAWTFGATAWIGQLLLVGGAAPIVRALDAGAPLSQLRALGRGALGIARAALPWLAAVAAIALGGLALAVPGLLLLGLLATTAASPRPGIAGPLADSAEVVRNNALLAGAALAVLLAVDLAIVYGAGRLLVPPLPPPKQQPPADVLAKFRTLLLAVAAATAAIAPWIATLLAAVHARSRRS